MVFTCGHSGEVPRNMGRGATRAKRLAAYFNRACKDCAVARAVGQAMRLTDIKGNLLTGNAQETMIVKYIDRAKSQY